MSDGPGLEERVAALEALTLRPATAEMTGEQAREFEREWQKAVTGPQQLRVLPQRQPLTQDEVRQLLRECVTVVRPGEVLVIRVPDLTPGQLYEYSEVVKRWLEDFAPGVRCLVTIGGELGVVQEPDDPLLRDCRVECFRNGSGSRWRVTHLPTGRVHHGDTREGAIENLKIGLEYFGSKAAADG